MVPMNHSLMCISEPPRGNLSPPPPKKVRTKKREDHFPSTDKRRLVKWVWMRWVCFRLADFVLHVWYDRVLYFGDFETSLYGIYIFLSCLDTYRCYRSSVISGALGQRDKLATKGERHSCMFWVCQSAFLGFLDDLPVLWWFEWLNGEYTDLNGRCDFNPSNKEAGNFGEVSFWMNIAIL